MEYNKCIFKIINLQNNESYKNNLKKQLYGLQKLLLKMVKNQNFENSGVKISEQLNRER